MSLTSVIATVLSSSVVVALITFFLALRRDHHLSHQARAERLFVAASSYCVGLQRYFTNVSAIYAQGGKLSGSGLPTNSEAMIEQAAQVEMLIAFYFVTLESMFKDLESQRRTIFKGIYDCEGGTITPGDFATISSGWKPASEALLSAITAEGRRFSAYEPWKSMIPTFVR